MVYNILCADIEVGLIGLQLLDLVGLLANVALKLFTDVSHDVLYN